MLVEGSRRRWPAVTVSFLAVFVLTLTGCPPTPDVPGDHLVEWTVNPEGSGRVDQTANGAIVTLVAVPEAGWEFDGWFDADLGDDDPLTNPLTVDATVVDSIGAEFVPSGDPPPGTPVDRDDDGVIDDDDDCLDTPADEVGDIDANGCGPSERDTDDDGVMDDVDECADTPPTVDIDEVGCPVSEPGTPDADGDGVPDDIDQCPGTARGANVDANGCVEDPDPVCGDGTLEGSEECDDGNTTSGDGCSATCTTESNGATCGNGIREAGEACDDGNTTSGDGCSATCTIESGGPECGNGVPETGETCDDGNTVDGDGCDSTCQVETVGPPNNSCASPTTVEDGTGSFSNVDATTDGPDEPTMCDFFERTHIQSDVWYCYTASCTDEVLVSLCGSDYDTKMAVYEGCDCPTEEPLACSDDDCGTGVEGIQSRITFQATAGQDYMIRIGGYIGEQGDGRLTIECGADACGTGTGDCFVESPTGDTGCGDPDCCATTCELDQFCCDVSWDSFCAGEAAGVCTDGFPACQTGIGSCSQPRGTEPGCGNVDCCNTVCDTDPFCCINMWDEACVDEANSLCFLTCHSRAGDCLIAHDGAGCNDISCCQAICPDDPFCCDTDWDEGCADKAATLCVE